jgi:hypothetical protein
MARKIRTKQEKKKRRTKIIIIVLVLLLLLGAGGFGGYKWYKKTHTRQAVEVKVLDSIDEYGYSVSDRDSKYYQKEFEELKKILTASSVDEEAYATQVAKLFAIDLYSIETKMNKYDIGGLEYFYKDKSEMYEKKVMDTIYETLLDDTYGDRKQSLPLVKEVTVNSTEKTKYTLGEEEKAKEVDGYLVKLEIKYKEDMGYDTEASIVVCKEDNSKRWSVVDFQPTLNPKYDTKDKKDA